MANLRHLNTAFTKYIVVAGEIPGVQSYTEEPLRYVVLTEGFKIELYSQRELSLNCTHREFVLSCNHRKYGVVRTERIESELY